MRDEQEDTTIYKVVVNHEEQYSIWPSYKENALGWRDAGKEGLKAECLAYINEVWTDMRPLSLRLKMEELKNAPAILASTAPETPRGPSLVEQLSEKDHPIVATLRGENSAAKLKERIDMGYVFIKFPETKGGTELGVRLTQELCDFAGANFTEPSGTVKLVGTLTLDYVKVECTSVINLETLTGVGRLRSLSS